MSRKHGESGDDEQRGNSHPQWDGAGYMRFDHIIGCPQFKTFELLISGIFHLIFLDSDWPWVTKTVESKPQLRGEWCQRIHCSKRVCLDLSLCWGKLLGRFLSIGSHTLYPNHHYLALEDLTKNRSPLMEHIECSDVYELVWLCRATEGKCVHISMLLLYTSPNVTQSLPTNLLL